MGAGCFGLEVLDLLERAIVAGATIDLVGFLDDAERDPGPLLRRHSCLLGPPAALPPCVAYLIAVGDPCIRARLDARLRRYGAAAPAVVDPAATLGSGVSLGAGTLVLAGARISTNARLGRHCHVNLNAVVAHDVVLGDFVSVSPGVNFGGSVTVGDRVLLGVGASLLPGVTVGDDACVGAGAVVVDDVAPGTTVAGVPARPISRHP